MAHRRWRSSHKQFVCAVSCRTRTCLHIAIFPSFVHNTPDRSNYSFLLVHVIAFVHQNIHFIFLFRFLSRIHSVWLCALRFAHSRAIRPKLFALSFVYLLCDVKSSLFRCAFISFLYPLLILIYAVLCIFHVCSSLCCLWWFQWSHKFHRQPSSAIRIMGKMDA